MKNKSEGKGAREKDRAAIKDARTGRGVEEERRDVAGDPRRGTEGRGTRFDPADRQHDAAPLV